MTVVAVYEVAFMSHAKKDVAANSSVVTPALNPVPKTAHRAKNPAETPANTATARKNVANLANLAMRNVPGGASIRNVPGCVALLAIGHVVMNLAKRFFLANIPVLVYAGKDARRSAESVTRTKSRRFSSELKTTRTQGLWNWPTVVMCLKWK